MLNEKTKPFDGVKMSKTKKREYKIGKKKLKNVKMYEDFGLNEEQKHIIESEELIGMLKSTFNAVKQSYFTEEALKEGNISDEQVWGVIIPRIFEWDYKSIMAVTGFALEDANYQDESEKIFKEMGGEKNIPNKKRFN